jgi:hypothetical protein
MIRPGLALSLLSLALIPLAAGCGGSDDPGGGAADAGDRADARVPAGDEVPASAGPLFAFLQARSYLEFPAESSVHASAGPHGQVRTFVNPTLEASLAAGGAPHPVGSAAIKELHSGGQLSGWAVAVKITEGTATSSWYWYEVFSTTSGEGPIEGIGLAGCASCHSAGSDHIRTPFPLQ